MQSWPELISAPATAPWIGGVQVGVVEHHERRLAAQLELGAVAVHGRGGHHLAADRRRPGEGHHVDVRVAGQCGARRRRPLR